MSQDSTLHKVRSNFTKLVWSYKSKEAWPISNGYQWIYSLHAPAQAGAFWKLIWQSTKQDFYLYKTRVSQIVYISLDWRIFPHQKTSHLARQSATSKDLRKRVAFFVLVEWSHLNRSRNGNLHANVPIKESTTHAREQNLAVNDGGAPQVRQDNENKCDGNENLMLSHTILVCANLLRGQLGPPRLHLGMV